MQLLVVMQQVFISAAGFSLVSARNLSTQGQTAPSNCAFGITTSQMMHRLPWLQVELLLQFQQRQGIQCLPRNNKIRR
jgi:hypothetical protein